MERRAAGALLALAACIASTAQAPTVSNQTSLDLYDAASEGCYYNFQHYGEGDRIMTNEPCLNCTCHNRMLMCYLRVCPFTKPIGQDCTVEKRADQCCPIVTCPDVPVDLLTSTSTSSPAEYGATGLGKLDKYGCSINGKYFPEGSKVPPTPNKPCEHCYCIRNMTTCVMQECTLHVDGCTPIYHKDVCCPVRYSCDHPEDEVPLLDDMSTTVRPTPGFLLTTTTLAPVTQMTQDCVHNDEIFPDGTSIKTEKACEHCYCMKGDIVCVVQECGTPMENEGKNCTSVAPREGQCCPDTYICEGDEVTTELMLDYTTEPALEKLTTLLPPRRVIDEGSGYRKEEEPMATEVPTIEPEVEGSGEDFATEPPSDEIEKDTPTLIDERISSTEDMIGMDTTPHSETDAEKSTTEPDSELNTVPSGTVESDTSMPKLTTISDVVTSSEKEHTDADSEITTSSLEHKEEDILAQTTESVFRKEDESHVPLDVTTERGLDEYTQSVLDTTKVTKDEGLDTATKQEPASIDESEFESTTPTLLAHSESEMITEIPITTTSDKIVEEVGTTLQDDHMTDTLTTTLPEKIETTTFNAQENEIEDVSTTQGPGRIPGEGDCLQNGITYRNESAVPSMNNCQIDCKCISSIIKCDPIICSAPPEYMSNCVPTYDSLESCCPTYVCDGSKETLPPQPHSQMSEMATSTPTPATECEGEQCEVQKEDKYPVPVSSDVPQTTDCESGDCKDIAQIPVQTECNSESCVSEIKPDLHEIPSPVVPESCSDGNCKQQPIEKDDSQLLCEGENCPIPTDIPKTELPCEGESCKIKPTDCSGEGCKLPTESSPIIPSCEGDNCNLSPTEPCQNEEECKNIPKVEMPCEGESCKVESTGCNGEGCKLSPESGTTSPPCEGDNCKLSPVEPCQNEEECKNINVPKPELPCKGESCKTDATDCNDEGCKIPSESIPVPPACEGDSCKTESTDCSEEDCKLPSETIPEHPDCVGEECKKEISPDVSGSFPAKCNGADCLSDTTELPGKTEVSDTESPLSTQDQVTETHLMTSGPTTKLPEIDDSKQSQTSEVVKETSTEKIVEITESVIMPTDLDKTDETLTTLPDTTSSKHEGIKDTTDLHDVQSYTELEPESMTTPALSSDSEADVSKTTEFDDSVTKTPGIETSTEILTGTEGDEHKISEETTEPEVTTDKIKDATQTDVSDSKPEIEMTESTIQERTTQTNIESSSQNTFEPLDEKYTEIPESVTRKEEAITESAFKPTDQTIVNEKLPVTETDVSLKEGVGISETPTVSSEIDEKITTSSPVTSEESTQENLSVTSATPDLYTTVSNVSDEPHDTKLEIPESEIQEPVTQTTTSPELHVDSEEPGKQDSVTTSKSDADVSITETSILPEVDISDTEKPNSDKERLPELPSEIFTEAPEIDTEEPSHITNQENIIQEGPVEPESQDYIPVHPITDKSEFDTTTPEINLDMVTSTEHKVYSSTPQSALEMDTNKPGKEPLLPDTEDITNTPYSVYTEQYDQKTPVTEVSIDISPTDTRKYNKDTTDILEPVTTVDELTTRSPVEEKLSESTTFSESTSLKPSIEEEQQETLPGEIFSTEKQDVIPTETPESHIKETESETTMTTEKSKPSTSEEPQTQYPIILEPKPTEFSTPTESVEDKQKPEEELERVTVKEPEQTSEHEYSYTETPPDMIELVEHNIMSDISTPSSTSEELTTAGQEMVNSEVYPVSESSTVKPETPAIEIDKATSAIPVPEDKITDEESSTPADVVEDHDNLPGHPDKVESHDEVEPPVEVSTLMPEKGEETPAQEVTTEILLLTEQPDASNLGPDTEAPEIIDIQKPEITEADIVHTTQQPQESVTDKKIKSEEELVTEEPGSGDFETKPDVIYSTEKSDVEIESVTEQESTTMVSVQPSIDEETVTEKINEKEKPVIDSEIVPVDTIQSTVPSELEQDNILDTVTGRPEIVSPEHEITSEQEFITEIPIIPTIIQEPKIELSTEHKIVPERNGIDESETPAPENEFIPAQETSTKQQEPEMDSFTKPSEFPVSDDELKLQTSTELPVTVEPDQNIVTDKETATELPVLTEKETQAPETEHDVKLEQEFTTEKLETGIDQELPSQAPEASDKEKETPTYETTSISTEDVTKPIEETVTDKATSIVDQKIQPETEPTERVTVPESESVTEDQSLITEKPNKNIDESDESDIVKEPTTDLPQYTKIEEKTTEKSDEQSTISSKPDTETEKPDDQELQEVTSKEPETSESSIPAEGTEPQRQYPTEKPEISDVDQETTTVSTEEMKPLSEQEPVTEESKKPQEDQEVKDEQPSSSEKADENEITERTTSVPSESGYDKEPQTTLPEQTEDFEKLTTSASSTPSSTEKEELPEKITDATPERYDDNTKPGDVQYTTPGYTVKDEVTAFETESQKPITSEQGTPVPTPTETEKPIAVDLTKETTVEEEFLTVTTKATTPKTELETSPPSEDLDKISKPHDTETSSPIPEVSKPSLNDVQATDDVPVPEEEGHFPPSATGGYGQEPDYEDENQPFGPGTCRYGGKVYVSAQQIPRDDPCDFCFCFRSDIICLQQSCPPPIHGCHEEPIQGFCCPRYECPVSMANTLNITTTTTTTTTTLPPHFLPHAYQGALQRRGCQIKGHTYKVGEVVRASSGPCLHCTCGGDGQMKCDPKACTPEPMLRQMIAAAVSAKRRR